MHRPIPLDDKWHVFCDTLDEISYLYYMKKSETVAEILSSCQVGDILYSRKRTWEVKTLDYDGEGTVVAVPVSWPKGKGSFELWSVGPESLAVIPGLKKAEKATESKEIASRWKDPKSFSEVLEQIELMASLGFNNAEFWMNKCESMASRLEKMGYQVSTETREDSGFRLYIEW